MITEDKVLLGMLRLSLNHNSQVLEIATNFIGNMSDRRNVSRCRKAFDKVHDKYNKEYEMLMNELVKDNTERRRTVVDRWSGVDPDDVDRYLMDYLNSKMSVDGEPVDDELLAYRMEDEDWVYDILSNIVGAVRAKNG